MQAAFAAELFRLSHEAGLNTCLDTSGCVLNAEVEALLAVTDRVLLDLKYVTEEKVPLKRKIYLHFTVFEEVGHGASASWPKDLTEVWSVDMGCVGEGLECTEHEVSICAKDSGGPYSYDVVSRMVEVAQKHDIKYAIDIYPSYASDVGATLSAGFDGKFGLIGPGVYASHGYERSHVDGVKNTFDLIRYYLED